MKSRGPGFYHTKEGGGHLRLLFLYALCQQFFVLARSDDYEKYHQMDGGWMFPRDRECALVAVVSAYQLVTSVFAQEYAEARARNPLLHGHRILYARSGAILRLGEQLQNVLLGNIHHKRTCQHCHRLWNLCR